MPRPQGAGSFMLDISVYFSPESDGDAGAIIDSFEGGRLKNRAKNLVRRFLGTA